MKKTCCWILLSSVQGFFGRRHLYEGSGWFADCRREQPSVLLERAMIALLKWLLLVVRFGSSHGRDLRLKAPS